jgi:hypothetical protein
MHPLAQVWRRPAPSHPGERERTPPRGQGRPPPLPPPAQSAAPARSRQAPSLSSHTPTNPRARPATSTCSARVAHSPVSAPTPAPRPTTAADSARPRASARPSRRIARSPAARLDHRRREASHPALVAVQAHHVRRETHRPTVPHRGQRPGFHRRTDRPLVGGSRSRRVSPQIYGARGSSPGRGTDQQRAPSKSSSGSTRGERRDVATRSRALGPLQPVLCAQPRPVPPGHTAMSSRRPT